MLLLATACSQTTVSQDAHVEDVTPGTAVPPSLDTGTPYLPPRPRPFEDLTLPELDTPEEADRFCTEYLDILLNEGCPDTYVEYGAYGGYPGVEIDSTPDVERYPARCRLMVASFSEVRNLEVCGAITVGDIYQTGREFVIPRLCDEDFYDGGFPNDMDAHHGPPGRNCIFQYR
ncbi:MAG: hypothetical protein AAF447_10060 [Myxococcota bacterium]